MNMSEESNDPNETLVDPGLIERQLKQGEDIELHFSSQNAQEENGAVLCTFQSSIPSFKGETLSHPMALHSSSAIRLLCHIMREPLFNSLRTKQQLGYIVSSGYEIGISSQSNESGQIPLTTPVDFIYINVLSQKMAPPDIVDRIDEFIQVFRKSLEEMPESEIIDHADSLSTKLLKPIQKLQSEASLHYSRIVRYGPEVHRSGDAHEIPWNTTQMLASTIRGLRREDLLKTFDTMTHPSTRCRVVSCVYGKKFPLKQSTESLKVGNTNAASSSQTTRNYLSSSKPFLSLLRGESYYPKTLKTTKIVDNFPELIKYRSSLPHFNPNGPSLNTTVNAGILSKLQKHHRRAFMVGLGLFGATIFGVTMANRFHGEKLQKQPSPKLDKTS